MRKLREEKNRRKNEIKKKLSKKEEKN